MSNWQIITETIPARSHYWWCRTCGATGNREPRVDFAYNAFRVHEAGCHG